MSDAWFDRYVTELIIRKEYLDDATRALLTTEPVELDPWQPSPVAAADIFRLLAAAEVLLCFADSSQSEHIGAL